MKTTSIAAVALTAALGLSACGSSDSNSPSSSSTSSSSSASSSASAAKAGESVDGAALATRMTDAMLKAGSGTVTMDLGTQGSAKGSFTMKDGKMEQSMEMGIQGQTLQIVSTGGIIYMKGLPGSSKPWVKIDPKGTDPMSKMFAGLTGDMGDPRQLATALKGSKATVVSSSADEKVYDVTIDPTALLGGSTATASPSVAPVKARYTLDSQDRPTKMTVDSQGQTINIVFSDWGKPVTITVPPADQVGTFQLPTS
ncbi:hypothetical protein [Phycicoccus sp. Root101]|uniref:hypothetical protein n=1 Tax=Phycicoccus sp. Root101 TaxID=1736421 RepID=UPI0007033154|nr:hypothetical protein [Phycicoccus sp. Root101]KQU64605.1 hypothetical protein ASC58_18985 [Phycicoccus sp. Root101]